MSARSGDDYRPRPHDHLVEPVFGGLGVGRESEVPRRGVLAALVRWLRALRKRPSSRRKTDEGDRGRGRAS